MQIERLLHASCYGGHKNYLIQLRSFKGRPNPYLEVGAYSGPFLKCRTFTQELYHPSVIALHLSCVTVHLCLTTLHLPASISQSDTPLSSSQLHSPVLSAVLWLYLSPSSTRTHCQIVLDACTRLSSVSLPDLPVSTLLASDYPASRISWK